jgi:phage baseplate assembly protein gpV
MCEATATTARSLPLREEGSPAVLSEESSQSLDEALRGVAGRATRWIEAPTLLVLTSVMDYQGGARTEYQATADRLSAEETNALIADLTAALAVLTGDTFTKFADVRLESPAAGATASVMRPGHIVVGRYRGVRDQLKTIGVGGRFRSGGAIKAGTVFLDADYDRTSSRRALLRTHELGHALGYDHVDSRPSIMNPRIGAEITEYDRRAAHVAFREEVVFRKIAPPCDGGPSV